MKKFVLCVLLLALLSLLLSACDTDPVPTTENVTVPTLTNPLPNQPGDTASLPTQTEALPGTEAVPDTETPTAEPEPVYEPMVISTEYADLKYPGKWADRVTVKTEGNAVRFSSGSVSLFDILFNGTEGVVLGTIQGEDRNTVVRMINYAIPADAADYDACCGMQEDVNFIMEALKNDYDFVAGKEVLKEDDSVFEIRTGVISLYYPNKWKDVVDVSVEDDAVRFSCGETPLFSVLFGQSEGSVLGSCNGTSVSITFDELDESGFSSEEFDRLCAMQEDVNVVIQGLMSAEDFHAGAN